MNRDEFSNRLKTYCPGSTESEISKFTDQMFEYEVTENFLKGFIYCFVPIKELNRLDIKLSNQSRKRFLKVTKTNKSFVIPPYIGNVLNKPIRFSLETLDGIDGSLLLNKQHLRFYEILKGKIADKALFNKTVVFLNWLQTHKLLIFKFQKDLHLEGYILKDTEKHKFANIYNILVKTSLEYFGAKHVLAPEYDPLECSWKVKKDKDAIISTCLFLHGLEDDDMEKVFNNNIQLRCLNIKFHEMVDDLGALITLKSEDFVDMYKALNYI